MASCSATASATACQRQLDGWALRFFPSSTLFLWPFAPYSLGMALPETIPVRYTEEEAEYLSVRPVVRQTFRLHELIDMLLGVTGKDLARIQQILRSGTIVFHFYRYWWEGFEAEAGELAAVLARFPDADPSRAFRAEACTAVLLESGAHNRPPVEIARAAAARKPLFRARSFWDCFLLLAADQVPAYREYSHARRSDLYE